MFTIQCPKCKKQTLTLDLNNTMAQYHNQFNNLNLVYPQQECPITVTKELVLTCGDHECNHSLKTHYSKFMEQVIHSWAELSWSVFLKEFNESFSYDQYHTRYLVDKDINQIVSKSDIENNPIIKDLINYIEAKRSK